ncbi:hypothetical protein JMJ77_0004095 [Colletotrichum scovillei]|uniref:Uncharacterized protein n=1 Tax=Colletotrichum scovillei TaxID=1209932 RepID=A0A9P7QWS5_9PEZI|nr:hypothetical protein JMJ77_0004095 [Colletotrichum scovillei]KAG7049371.1 hypothetical protein JMJ78_0013354 [Colletotrichum scovillei]KAG7064084.1 hypothetical protein JMJ76_0007132 [Colletotrichum scovillei]
MYGSFSRTLRKTPTPKYTLHKQMVSTSFQKKTFFSLYATLIHPHTTHTPLGCLSKGESKGNLHWKQR